MSNQAVLVSGKYSKSRSAKHKNSFALNVACQCYSES